MQNRQKLNQEIELISTLKLITQAYQEISVMKMQKIRESVLNTRDYLGKFSQVYFDVKQSHRLQIERLMKEKKIKNVSEFTTFNKNGRTLSLFLSANTKMYGDIINRTYRLFEESIIRDNSDVAIVGKLGKELFEKGGKGRAYQYFEIPDMDLSVEDLKPLISYIVNYQKVNVFYGRFENIAIQNPSVTNVTGDVAAEEELNSQEDRHFLFEPTLEKILNFFETQIFTLLFKQTVLEGQLARFASRIMAMEKALDNIENRSKNLYGRKRRYQRLLDNKKQLNTLSGVALWAK